MSQPQKGPFRYELIAVDVQQAPGQAPMLVNPAPLGVLTRSVPVHSGDVIELGGPDSDDFVGYEVAKIVHPHKTVTVNGKRQWVTTSALLVVRLSPLEPEVLCESGASGWEPTELATVTVTDTPSA